MKTREFRDYVLSLEGLDTKTKLFLYNRITDMLEREEIIGLLVGLVIGLIGGLLFGFTMGVQSISTTPKIYAWNNTIM